MRQRLLKVDGDKLTGAALLKELCNTKEPQIFAESQVYGNGRDWNLTELQLLGDISIAAQVNIFDNGKHKEPDIHHAPFKGTLIFTSGALLRNDLGFMPADWAK